MGQFGNFDLHVKIMELLTPYLPRLLTFLYVVFGLAAGLGVPMERAGKGEVKG